MPPPSWSSRSASTGRADRIGPTRSASSDWNTANRRVWPPSTSSSYTRSAWFRPDCGKAPLTLSILTDSAGRPALLAAGNPVSGYRGGGAGAEVVVGADVVVGAGALVARVCDPLLQPTVTTTNAART